MSSTISETLMGVCLAILAGLVTLSQLKTSQWLRNYEEKSKNVPLLTTYIQCSMASLFVLLQTLRSPCRQVFLKILCGGWGSCPPQGYSPLNQLDVLVNGKDSDSISKSSTDEEIDEKIENQKKDQVKEEQNILRPALKSSEWNKEIQLNRLDRNQVNEVASGLPTNQQFKPSSPEYNSPFLTQSIWLPLNTPLLDVNDAELTPESRRVRFSKLTEVRFLTKEQRKPRGFFLFSSPESLNNSYKDLTDESSSYTIDTINDQQMTNSNQCNKIINAIRKALNFCLLWFLICYCCNLLLSNSSEQQNLFTFYAFLVYFLLFFLFFQLVIFDSYSTCERVNVCKTLLLILAMFGLNLLLITNQSSSITKNSFVNFQSKTSGSLVDYVNVEKINSISSKIQKSEEYDGQSNYKLDYKHMFLIIVLAFCLSFYLCSFSKREKEKEPFCIPTFVGSMGLFNLIMLFPVLMLLHFGNKSIQLPNRSQLIQITLNGVLGQMIAHPIWIWGCWLTSTQITLLFIGALIPLQILVSNSSFDHLNIYHLMGAFLFGVVLISIVVIVHLEKLYEKSIDFLLVSWLCGQRRRASKLRRSSNKLNSLLDDQDFD